MNQGAISSGELGRAVNSHKCPKSIHCRYWSMTHKYMLPCSCLRRAMEMLFKGKLFYLKEVTKGSEDCSGGRNKTKQKTTSAAGYD